MSIFDEELSLGPWFSAYFDSECAECPRKIYADDQVRYKDREVVCETCGEGITKEEMSAVICSVCFITLSAKERRECRTMHKECE
jgi:hypothetical protein